MYQKKPLLARLALEGGLPVLNLIFKATTSLIGAFSGGEGPARRAAAPRGEEAGRD